MAADARYRPAAPGDGFGHVLLSEAEVGDPVRLEQEAHKYARQFKQDDDRMEHWTGCANYNTNRALVFTIEAARALCSGGHDQLALDLLCMAIREVTAEGKLDRI
jgi:hypothetical protein